jgi:ABC-2 type transport system permease protein
VRAAGGTPGRAIAALVGAGFRRQSRYRAAVLAGSITNSVFGLLRASIITASIAAAGGQLGGYAAAQGITYVWVSQALLGPLQLFHWEDLAVRIRTGDIAVDLARPLDLQLQYAAQDAGRALAVAVPRGAPILLVGALTFGLALPDDPWAYAAGLVSICLGVAVSFACRYLVNLAAIWLLDLRGVLTVYVTVATTLCGLVVPVSWFPPWLAAIAAASPFPAMLQAPADVLTGRVEGGAVAGVLLTQLAWLAGVAFAGQVVQRLGTRHLVVQGG